ncbi:MAG: type IV secretion system DNA-binding domain-containing protein [bacterium]|nr:type IV secretion system DNA-binding domain-containing protein [bacterium]
MEFTPHLNYFGQTDFRGERKQFGIRSEDRSRHMYVIGKTGMGKSTLLENLAIQDIKNGEGLCFIDPHGGTADKLLDYVPEERIKDVLYFAPFDLDNPIAFNVMEDIGVDKRHLVLSGLMSAFKKLFGEESFSDRMQYILQNTILALLEYPDATMLGINKMLSEKEYRNKVIANIKDPSVKSYWTKEYAGYTERFAAEAIPAIQNKIGQFTSNPLVRNIIGQSKSTFDFRQMMDEKKILIINLSKGRLGETNANLLGSMIITKLYLSAMSRADTEAKVLAKLPSFFLYVDEFQSFANESFADILSEARKYKLALTIAHQYIEQMPEEVRAAVFGNVGTTICFRVGPFDAEVLEKVFFPTFTVEDLVNLGRFQMYLSLMIDGVGSPPFSATTIPPIVQLGPSFKDDILIHSRAKYGKPRAEVEETIKQLHSVSEAPPKPVAPASPRPVVKSVPTPIKPVSPPIAPAVKKMSLADLAPKKAVETEAHKSELKAILEQVINSQSKPEVKEVKLEVKLKEVPEEVLKKMLEV